MKPLSYSLIAAALACGFSFAQTTAVTDPVGYITITLPGGGATAALQLANQGLLPGDGLAYAGVAESIVGTTLTDDQGTWAAGDFVNGSRVSHVVEITSAGALQGAMSWVTSTAANTITTADDLSAAGANATFRVWKTFTITSLLGDPPTATVLGGGATQGAADNFLLLDPTTGVYQTYWYKSSGVGGTGWRSSGIANADVPTTAIFPSDGMLVQRKQATPGSLVITGAVKTGKTQVLVQGGAGTVLNIIATQIPTDQLTPDNSGLYTGDPATGLKGGATQGAADSLLIFDAATNTYTTFWYKNSGVGGTGWRASGIDNALVPTTIIPGNKALLIQRKGGASFTWNVPAVIIAP